MNLKDDIAEQREYLENNLEQLNIVVSAILGYKTELKIIQDKNYRGEVYYKITDDRNIREQCGAMAKAFKKVTIENFGMWWQNNKVVMDLQFNYELNDGGTNGAKFFTISIEDDLVKIM